MGTYEEGDEVWGVDSGAGRLRGHARDGVGDIVTG